jgi:hypothetical protein
VKLYIRTKVFIVLIDVMEPEPQGAAFFLVGATVLAIETGKEPEPNFFTVPHRKIREAASK